MSDHSKIEWTDTTWNPIRGCVKITPGCKNCYAETFAERFRGVPNHPYEQGFDPRLVPTKLNDPFKWRRPRMVFVNSMTDLFQDFVPDDYIREVAEVMTNANWHTYQVLTKRAERMKELLCGPIRFASAARNIWWGVSVENKQHGLPRVECLRSAPGFIHFLSVEPLLENLGEIDLSGIDWVIVGGESGSGARPMKREWVLNILEQCRRQDVRFFFKQWGGVNKARAGRLLDGKTYDEFPDSLETMRPAREKAGLRQPHPPVDL